MQNEQLRLRLRPLLAELQKLCLHSRAPITGLRIKSCPYHGWAAATEVPAGEGWAELAEGEAIGGHDVHYAIQGQITAPAQSAGQHLVCLVSTGATDIWNYDNPQFLAYIDGRLVCGLDVNHTEFDLPAPVAPGQGWRLGLYAYCSTAAKDVFLKAETAVRDDKVTALYYDLKAPYEVMALLEPDDPSAIAIGRCLKHAADLLDLRQPYSEAFYSSLAAASSYMDKEFYNGLCARYSNAVKEGCVGHTHIDVAWLWTLAQTHEKAIRSFATVNYLMERYPEYRFVASQPQLYDFVRRDCPELYQRISARVAEGRWEPEGGMWLEADCNMTSGESLVRQFLHGQQFFAREFGKTDNHILWLPDAFGFSGALPQIMKQCGMKWFMTTKLAWNDTNCIPHDLMRWRGIDGSEVMAYFISTKDYKPARAEAGSFQTTYNGLLNPKQVMGCWQRFQDKDLTQNVLQCYGYGDGGGGPTAEMLEMQRRMAYGIPGAPQTYQTGAAAFFDALEAELKSSGAKLPTWSGEFYFEYHRGVFTSQARNKYANRKAEFANLTAESLAALAECTAGAVYPAEALHENWELTLLNQFHDILPGSALGEVYRDSQQQYEQVLSSDEAITATAMQAVAARVRAEKAGVLVFNQLGFERDAVVSVPCAQETSVTGGGALLPSCQSGGVLTFVAKNLPAKGWRFYPYAAAQAQRAPILVQNNGGEFEITTPFYIIVLTGRGTLSRLYDIEAQREVLAAGREGNELQLFDDRPVEYDAWNIERWYEDNRFTLSDDVKVELIENSAVRCRFSVERTVSRSSFKQHIIFYPHSRRIDFETWVDWHEEHVLLKTAFPTDICAPSAQYDIQFGSIARPVHENTSWDAARFEVCAHKWADLSEPCYGVALLNNGRYGYDVHDGVLRLSLLRAPTYPDQQADRGEHHFTYALLPHMEDWRRGGVIEAGYDLNAPARALALPAQSAGELPPVYSQFSVDKPNVILETVKRAENGKGLIVRLYEAWGARTRAAVSLPAAARAVRCTPLETPLPDAQYSAQGQIDLELRPFELCTLRVEI